MRQIGLGDRGRHRPNLWTYAGANTFSKDLQRDLAEHPTLKSIEMVRDTVLDCSKRGGVVLDAFAGERTTLIAAARTNRRGCGIEIDPHYADLIVRRLQEKTGETAIHSDSQATVGDLCPERAGLVANV